MPYEELTLTIRVTEQPYQDETDSHPGVYLGLCEINGVSHHIDLLEVNGRGEVKSPEKDEAVAHVYAFAGDDDTFGPITINGRHFICIITPMNMGWSTDDDEEDDSEEEAET
jgi:hypothetical protein